MLDGWVKVLGNGLKITNNNYEKEEYYLSKFDSNDDCVKQLLGTPLVAQ